MTNKLNFDGLRRNVASTAGFIPNVLAQMNTPEVSSEMTSLTINLKTPYTINRFQISTSFVGKKDQTDGNQNTSTSINIHRHICRGILNDRFIVSDTAAENEREGRVFVCLLSVREICLWSTFRKWTNKIGQTTS